MGDGSNKLHAETRDLPSQDPRDHKEPFRHDIHPGTSKQTPTTPGPNDSGWRNEKRVKRESETRSKMKMTAIATAVRAPSESAQLFFSSIIIVGSCKCTLAVHTAFKTESNAIELAIIASSTALMQACKRRAARAVNLAGSEVQLCSTRLTPVACPAVMVLRFSFFHSVYSLGS